MADLEQQSLDEELGIVADDQKEEQDSLDESEDNEQDNIDQIKEENSDLKISDTQQKIEEIQNAIGELSDDLKQLEETKQVVESKKEIGLDPETAKTVTITVERIVNKYNKVLSVKRQIRNVALEGFNYSSTKKISTEGLLESISKGAKTAWEFIVKLIKKLIDGIKELYSKLFDKSKMVSATVKESIKKNEELIKKIESKPEEDLTIEFDALPILFKGEDFNTVKELNDKVRLFQKELSDFMRSVASVLNNYTDFKFSEAIEDDKYIDQSKFNIKLEKQLPFGITVNIDTFTNESSIGRTINKSSNQKSKQFNKADLLQINATLKSLDDELKYVIELMKTSYQNYETYYKQIEDGFNKIINSLDQELMTRDLIQKYNTVLRLTKEKIDTINHLVSPNCTRIISQVVSDYRALIGHLYNKMK